MRVLVFLSFLFASLFMVGLTIFMWTESTLYGVGGLIGIVGFYIAYAISGDMVIAPRDFWRFSSWEVFKKKMSYAFTAFGVVAIIAAGVLTVIFE